MGKLISRTLNAAKTYTAADFAILKITLVFAGIIIGSYFSAFFLNHTLFIWLVFIIAYIWIMHRTFIK